MYNVTLVCTHHSEFGRCNSDELYKIIESLKPDVIFEELNQDLFDKFYTANNIPWETPEIKSVRRYLLDHDITHFPVDISVSPNVSKAEIDYMFQYFNKYTAYSKLKAEQKNLIFQNGYNFLNSKKSEDLNEKMKYVEKSLIAFQTYNHQLTRIYKLFYEEQHNREDEIIQNIYNYSRKIEYNQAVLLLGSGHRKTIFEKMENHESEINVNINWALYGN